MSSGRLINCSLKSRHDYANAYWGGSGALSGTVKIGANVAQRRVRLYESNTGILIREIWAANDGSYTFSGMRTDTDYTVTSTDYSKTYNDVIAARVRAV